MSGKSLKGNIKCISQRDLARATCLWYEDLFLLFLTTERFRSFDFIMRCCCSFRRNVNLAHIGACTKLKIKRTSSNATKNVRTPMKRLDQFVHPMAMCIVHYAKWKRKRVAVVWCQCHWKIVQQLPFVMPIVMRKRPQIQPVSFVVQIINFIAANAICAKNIAVNIYSLYRWNVVWPHSHSKDALECVHRIMVSAILYPPTTIRSVFVTIFNLLLQTLYAAQTINPIQTNAFWT